MARLVRIVRTHEPDARERRVELGDEPACNLTEDLVERERARHAKTHATEGLRHGGRLLAHFGMIPRGRVEKLGRKRSRAWRRATDWLDESCERRANERDPRADLFELRVQEGVSVRFPSSHVNPGRG